MVGDGARVLVQRAVGPANLARVDEVLEGFKLHYDVHCLDATELYPGLASSLDALVAAGWHLAVLSNKPEDFSRRCVAALMSHWPIAAIVGGRDNLPRKPDPAGALEIAATLGRNPRDMYMVGDSPTDVATGKAAGMVPVAATWGFRDRDVLVDSGPALLVDHPAELAQILIAHRAAFAR
jgi:phosphoglycolate phosphatase